MPLSCHCVASVHSQVCSRHVTASLTQQEGDRAHQIFWSAHLAHRDQGGPLFLEVWIIVQNLSSSAKEA
jgi:hypothetical protein